MYFRFYELHDWAKRSDSCRRRFHQRFLSLEEPHIWQPPRGRSWETLSIYTITSFALIRIPHTSFQRGISQNKGLVLFYMYGSLYIFSAEIV